MTELVETEPANALMYGFCEVCRAARWCTRTTRVTDGFTDIRDDLSCACVWGGVAVMDLATWLLAQIADDEQVARAADGDPTFDGTGIINRDVRHPAQVLLSGTARHIARWDPKRVLDECDAKRRIIERAFGVAAMVDGEWGCCHSAEQIRAGKCEDTNPNDLPELRDLALPYASRDGYQAEWKP